MEIQKVGELAFDVFSESGQTYFVAFVDQWVCTCDGFYFGKGVRECKHIKAVKELIENGQP